MGTYTDIFISYARNDNDPSGSKKGFISRLEEELSAALKRKTGQAPVIFADWKITTGTKWEKEIEDQLRESYIFLPVISKAYGKSRFCGDEWRIFRLKVEKDGGNGNRTRIMPITYELDDRKDLPEGMRDIQTEFAFKWIMTKSIREKAIDKLAEQIIALLPDPNEAQNFAPATQTPSAPSLTASQAPSPQSPLASQTLSVAQGVQRPSPAARCVFLGIDCTEDMKESKERVRAELRAAQFELREAEFDYRKNETEFRNRLKTAMADCMAAVHFFAEEPGATPLGSNKSLTRIQLETAAEVAAQRAAAGQRFDQYYWTGPYLKVTELKDPAYRDVVEGKDYSTERVYEFIRSLRRKLQDVPPGPPPQKQVPLVVLICESGDADVAAEISKYFLEKKRWWVDSPKGTEKTAKVLRDENYFLFYWGAAAKDWYEINRDLLRDARRVDAGVQLTSAGVVYFASRETSEKKEAARPPQFREIRTYDRFDEAHLREFEQDVEQDFYGA